MNAIEQNGSCGSARLRAPIAQGFQKVLLCSLFACVACSSGKTSFGNRVASTDADAEFMPQASQELAQPSPEPVNENLTKKPDGPAQTPADGVQRSTANSVEVGDPRQNYGGSLEDPLKPDTTPDANSGTPPGNNGVGLVPQNVASGPLAVETVEQEIVDECLKRWKEAGIDGDASKNYTQKNVEVKLGNASGTLVFSDKLATKTAHFMIVSIEGQNMNGSLAEFLNPQGWYCVHVAAQNMNGFKFIKKKSAQLKILTQEYQNAIGFKIEEVE